MSLIASLYDAPSLNLTDTFINLTQPPAPAIPLNKITTALAQLASITPLGHRDVSDVLRSTTAAFHALKMVGRPLDDAGKVMELLRILGSSFPAWALDLGRMTVQEVSFEQAVASLLAWEEVERVEKAKREVEYATSLWSLRRGNRVLGNRGVGNRAVVVKKPCTVCGPGADHAEDRCGVGSSGVGGVKGGMGKVGVGVGVKK